MKEYLQYSDSPTARPTARVLLAMVREMPEASEIPMMVSLHTSLTTTISAGEINFVRRRCIVRSSDVNGLEHLAYYHTNFSNGASALVLFMVKEVYLRPLSLTWCMSTVTATQVLSPQDLLKKSTIESSMFDAHASLSLPAPPTLYCGIF